MSELVYIYRLYKCAIILVLESVCIFKDHFLFNTSYHQPFFFFTVRYIKIPSMHFAMIQASLRLYIMKWMQGNWEIRKGSPPPLL